MFNKTKYLHIILCFFYLIACKDKISNEVEEQIFFNPKYANSAYFSNLALDSPWVCVRRMRNEVPQKWWTKAYEGFFFSLPDSIPNSTILELLTAYEHYFPSDSTRAFCQLIRGRLFIERAQYDTAMYCLQDCYTLSQRNGRESRATDAVRLIGRCHIKQGEFPQGIEYLLEAYESYKRIFEKTDDGGRLIETIIEITAAYKTSKNFEKAQEWGEQSWQYSCKHNATGYMIATAGRLAECYLNLGNLAQAKKMIDTAFYLQNFYKNNYNEDERFYILGRIEAKLENCEIALNQYKKAINTNITKDNVFKKYRYMQGLADGYHCIGKYDSALFFYEKAMLTPDSSQKAEILVLMSDVCAKVGNYKNAFLYKQKGEFLKSTIFTAEKNKAIGHLEAKNEVNKKEWTLKQHQQNFKIRQLIIVLLFVVMGVSLVFVILWSSRQRQRSIIMEQELKLIAEEKRNIEIKEQLQMQTLNQINQNLYAKQKALTAAQKVIELKNALIEELELKTHDDKKETDVRIFRNARILTVEDWHKFRNLFDKTFPDFYEQQKTQFPNLTTAEIRLFMLLKVGFNNAEIAYALGISVDSVYKTRYRLRRKLEISEEYDLEKFTKTF